MITLSQRRNCVQALRETLVAKTAGTAISGWRTEERRRRLPATPWNTSYRRLNSYGRFVLLMTHSSYHKSRTFDYDDTMAGLRSEDPYRQTHDIREPQRGGREIVMASAGWDDGRQPAFGRTDEDMWVGGGCDVDTPLSSEQLSIHIVETSIERSNRRQRRGQELQHIRCVSSGVLSRKN